MRVEKIKISSEIKGWQRPRTEDESSSLREAIRNDGRVRDKLIVWKETGQLLDGFGRLETYFDLKQSGVELPVPEIEEHSFPDKDAARRWVSLNQLGRRNLTETEYRYQIGSLHNATKGAPSAELENVEKSKKTRFSKVAKAIDKIAAVEPQIAEDIRTEKVKVSEAKLNKVAELPPEKIRDAIVRPEKKPSKPLDANSWQRPLELAARAVDEWFAARDLLQSRRHKAVVTLLDSAAAEMRRAVMEG